MSPSTARLTSRSARTSGRSLPRVGARLRERPDAPRMISHEDGRVLSGQAMAAAKAQGIADALYHDRRFVRALERYVAYHARSILAEHRSERAHPDDLYLRLWKRLQHATVPAKRGAQFWVKRSEGIATVWRQVLDAHGARVRTDAVRYPATGCASDERDGVAVVDAVTESFGGA